MAFSNGFSTTDKLRKLEEQEKEGNSKTNNPSDGCYLFILFPTHGGKNVQEAGQDCVRASRTVGIYGGRFVGIARKVFSYGYESSMDEGCIVFYFPSRDAANMFFRSDPKFKQPDFPQCAGHCQAWVVDRHYTPDSEAALNTFMISEIRLKDPDCYMHYKHNFATPFADLLQKYNAQPYVVQTSSVMGIRRFYKDPNHIVTVHLFRSPLNLEDVMNDGMYQNLRKTHNSLAYEMTTVFTIDPRACP
ncbi:uncharacterized protein [Haliotis asinina]|uniref:uncharacterized protein isoform X2 n=1 Tax=Haliotis asinina TaxID=109174 RepID=UPI003531E027